MKIIITILCLIVIAVWYCGYSTSKGVENNRQAIQALRDLINEIEDSTRHMQ